MGAHAANATLRRLLTPSLAEALFALWCAYLIVVDPLFIDTYGDRVAANFYNAVFSPLYPASSADHDGQKEIVVLVYDDEYLRASGTSWGFSPNNYKPLFTRVAEAGARAVFFDIQFLRGDGSRDAAIGSLYQHAKALEGRHRTKFVFASVLADGKPKFADESANHYALAEMHASEGAYALFQRVSKPSQEVLPTAATALYQIWCEGRCDEQIPSDVDKKLFIEWGYAPDPEMLDHSAGAGEGACQQLGASKFVDVARQIVRVITGTAGSATAPCMYHRNFSVYFINSLRDTAELQRVLQDKIVLIGTNLEANSDYTPSPVHGTIPGVFRHAMALDNLIERGPGYIRWVDDRASQTFEVAVLVLMLAALLWFSGVLVPNERQGVDADVLRVLYGAGAGLFLWLVVLATIVWFHLGPNNWVNYALMFLLVADVSGTALWRLLTRKLNDGWARIRARGVWLILLMALLAPVGVTLALAVALLLAASFVVAIAAADRFVLVYLLESIVLAAVLYTIVAFILRRSRALRESTPADA